MASQGAITSPTDTHTTIPGIWAKLSTLYNLPILDDREDSLLNHDLLLPDDETGDVELYSPFALPENEYGAKMFARRLDPDGSRSPPDEEAGGRPPSRRESTVADTDEPGSSPAPGGRRSGRKARTPAAARGPRVSKLQHEIDGGRGGSSSRRTSKATSVNEDEAMEDAAEDADGADSDDGEGSGEEDESGNARKRRKISSGKGSVGRGTGGGSARRSARKK